MAFPTGWSLLGTYTVNSSQVDSDATDFPVLLSDTEGFDANVFSNTDNGGGDLRFSSDEAGSSQLACEVVDFDTAASQAEVWVKRTLSSSSDTVIYIWGDNTGQSQPAASDTYGSQNVWDSNYVYVAHLDGDATDSTSSGPTMGTTGTPDDADPAFGDRTGAGAQNFSGSTEYYTSTATVFEVSERTFEVWVYRDASQVSGLFSKNASGPNRGYYFYCETDGDGRQPRANDWAVGNFEATNFDVTLTTWHYLATKNDSTWTTPKTSMDGAAFQAGSYGGTTLSWGSTFALGAVSAGSLWNFDGKMDEFRISNTQRADDWLDTCYKNQSAPGTFGTAAEAGGAPAAPAPTTGFMSMNTKIWGS